MARAPLKENETTQVVAVRLLRSTKATLDKSSERLRDEHYNVTTSALARILIEKSIDSIDTLVKGKHQKLPDHPDNLKTKWRATCKACAKVYYTDTMRVTCSYDCASVLRKTQGNKKWFKAKDKSQIKGESIA